MNRIEARIIIMVTNRLAAAKDSAAKMEMIEELSENLYQRYLELTERGMAEEEALRQALDSLGDVDELLAFLKETEESSADAAETAQDDCAQHDGREETAEDGREDGQEWSETDGQNGSRTQERTSSFSREDLENGIEEIVNAALSVTKAAVDCARDVAKDVSDQLKERYPDGVFTQFSGQKGRSEERMTIPDEPVKGLEIRLTYGDIVLKRTQRQEIELVIEGDTQEIRTACREDGVLSVVQGNTASAAFLFLRGGRRTNVTLLLPQKVWESVIISTTSGDVDIEDELICRELKISTTSGELTIERGCADSMELKLCSGDISGDDLSGDLHAESRSGDIDISGCLGRCELLSTSGDVKFAGVSRELFCTSTSGDVELVLERLPERVECSSTSGDCEITVPEREGFHLSYRTVSGSFSTDLVMSGRVEKKCGDVICGDTVCGEISLSSVSGDIKITGR